MVKSFDAGTLKVYDMSIRPTDPLRAVIFKVWNGHVEVASLCPLDDIVDATAAASKVSGSVLLGNILHCFLKSHEPYSLQNLLLRKE